MLIFISILHLLYWHRESTSTLLFIEKVKEDIGVEECDLLNDVRLLGKYDKIQSYSCVLVQPTRNERKKRKHANGKAENIREATFVPTLYRIDWCQNELTIESRTKTDTRVSTNTCSRTGNIGRRYQSAPEGRSGSGDGRMDGWKRIKLSVINNAAWSPRSSFYAGTVAHTHVSQGRRSSPRLAMTRLITPRRR